MDYKKIIKSRDTRYKILNALSFIPDELMIRFQYWIKTGRRLNLKNPKRYTEKIQWYKLKYKSPLMVKCADKYDVREYVENAGLGAVLNDCYGVYESAEEVDFDVFYNPVNIYINLRDYETELEERNNNFKIIIIIIFCVAIVCIIFIAYRIRYISGSAH